MKVNKEYTSEEKQAGAAPVEPAKPLTRDQKRRNERVTEEARKTYEAICERFLDFFTNVDDPTGPEVGEKAAGVSKQWRIYCQRKGLLAQAYPIVDEFIKGLITQYNSAAIIVPPAEEPEPTTSVTDETDA